MCFVVALGIGLELAHGAWRIRISAHSFQTRNLTKAYFPPRTRTPRDGDNPKLGVGFDWTHAQRTPVTVHAPVAPRPRGAA
jgi:hypothetical protein